MTPFECLVLAHLVGDWLLQTNHQAMNKARGRWPNRALVSHSLTYTLCIAVACWAQDISAWWLAWVFITHLVLDYRRPVQWWRRVVARDAESPFWLLIVTDQVFHLIVLAVMVR